MTDKYQDKKYQVSFLPWAGLKDEVSIGKVKLCPWNKIDRSSINTEILNWLDEYFKRHVDYKDIPVKTIVLCYIEPLDFRILNEYEKDLLYNASNILCFSVIEPQVVQHIRSSSCGISSAQSFHVTHQGFETDKDIIAINESIKLSEVRFQKSFSIHGSNDPEQIIINSFNELLKSNNKKLMNRILRSLDWFFFSHIESNHIKPESKIVMMATAFEILLNLEQHQKTRKFAEKLDKNISTSEFKNDTRKIGKGEYNGQSAGCWGIDFYKLRSEIVHEGYFNKRTFILLPEHEGEYKNGNPFHRPEITHLMVADAIFF